MKDRILVCVQCGNDFVFSVSQQEKCDAMGFDEPHRCQSCRRHKSLEGDGISHTRSRDKKKHYRMKYYDGKSGGRMR